MFDSPEEEVWSKNGNYSWHTALATHDVCSLNLQKNMSHGLRAKIGVTPKILCRLVNAVFAEIGITSCTGDVSFENAVTYFQEEPLAIRPTSSSHTSQIVCIQYMGQ